MKQNPLVAELVITASQARSAEKGISFIVMTVLDEHPRTHKFILRNVELKVVRPIVSKGISAHRVIPNTVVTADQRCALWYPTVARCKGPATASRMETFQTACAQPRKNDQESTGF